MTDPTTPMAALLRRMNAMADAHAASKRTALDDIGIAARMPKEALPKKRSGGGHPSEAPEGAKWKAAHGRDWRAEAVADVEALGIADVATKPKAGRPRKWRPETIEAALQLISERLGTAFIEPQVLQLTLPLPAPKKERRRIPPKVAFESDVGEPCTPAVATMAKVLQMPCRRRTPKREPGCACQRQLVLPGLMGLFVSPPACIRYELFEARAGPIAA